ncbi:putative P450 monooxygenase [Rhizodiscina lignyota]|uniref:P450 monooxygenase n=1 Tax=Rhizodiscina lignyota TaxID=1504668 RepID=A0A9P4M6H2_9PEZI|nr:putative P450 monooxygenase [Rhizodiscina lignyota]
MLSLAVRILTNPFILISLFITTIISIISWACKPTLVPKEIPWVGKPRSRIFPRTTASLLCFFNVRKIFDEGYRKYSQYGKAYIYPSYSGPPEVIIPRCDLPWLLDQPETVVSSEALQRDLMEGQYAFTDPQLLQFPFHSHILVRYLTRRVACLLPDIWDELQHAISTTWGFNNVEWRDICVWDNMMSIIASTSNRMFVGKPLCRNEDYLSNAIAFANDVTLSVTALSLVPSFLKPLLGPLITLPNHYHYHRTARHTLPIIKDRLMHMRRKQFDPTYKWTEPNDYITWHIQQAMSENIGEELDPIRIARRLMPINFAAIHTTALTITNAIFDIFSGPNASFVVESLREEAERVYAECNGHWTKDAAAKLLRLDSALRESMRLSGFLTRSVFRKVVSPDGLTHPREGWTIPQGAWVAVDVISTHHDDSIYDFAGGYDPFRFSRPREEALSTTSSASNTPPPSTPQDSTCDSASDKDEVLWLKNQGMVSTSDTFLGFGAGRHSCPGRFFVAHELKMLLVYILINYDIEPMAQRPSNMWFGTNILPDMKATIRVRRRKGASPEDV